MIKSFKQFVGKKNIGGMMTESALPNFDLGKEMKEIKRANEILNRLFLLYNQASDDKIELFYGLEKNFRKSGHVKKFGFDGDSVYCMMILASLWAEVEPNLECRAENMDEISQNTEIMEECLPTEMFGHFDDDDYVLFCDEIKNNNELFEIMKQFVEIFKIEEFSRGAGFYMASNFQDFFDKDFVKIYCLFLQCFLTGQWHYFVD